MNIAKLVKIRPYDRQSILYILCHLTQHQTFARIIKYRLCAKAGLLKYPVGETPEA